MESLSNIPPMTWLIFASAAIICVLVLFSKSIQLSLKPAVIAVMLLFVVYFLIQAGIIQLS
ncbi:MAG: hypothetical protein OEL75_02045 [Kiritimatiellaceae bacterium]|nr:hypothetical protein [Kiritimatiellaceae bacterium]